MDEAPRKVTHMGAADCPCQRMESMATETNEGFEVSGYFEHSGVSMLFQCVPSALGFLCSVDHNGQRYSKGLPVESVTEQELTSAFFELARMHKARVADGEALRTALQTIVDDLAGGKSRLIALDGAACLARLDAGAVTLEATAADGLRLVLRAKRANSVDTLMSLLGQANRFMSLRASKSLDEIADMIEGRGAKFIRRRRGGKDRLYGVPLDRAAKAHQAQ